MQKIPSKLALATAVSIVLSFGVVAQEAITPATSTSTDELIERERIRSEVALILEEFLDRAANADAHVWKANTLADRAALHAADYAPFFAEELERDRPATFDLCALALGKMPTPVAETALLRAIERADEELGDNARTRKAMAIWALGLQGRIAALELIDVGRQQVANFSIHRGTSVLAAVAYQLGPQSVPYLLDFADKFLAEEEREYWMLYVLGALRWVADPTAVPQLVSWTKHPNGLVRREALRALRTAGTDEAIDALFAALGSEKLGVRRAAAGSLEFVEPTGRDAEIRKQLESQDDSLVRGSLYQMLAASSGVKALPALSGYWGSDDVKDRRELIDAVITLDSSKAIDLFALALADPDLAVVMRAASGLGKIRNRRAIALLTGAIEHGDWLVVQAVLKALVPLHARSAGPALAERLLRDLQEPVVDSGLRSNLVHAADALVELRYPEAAELLSEAAERQPDHGLVQALRSAATRLRTLEEIGTTVPKWAELASGPDAEMRALARSRLAEIGGAPAVSALESSFDTVPARERPEVLEALGDTASDQAAGLIERVLTSPEFATAEALLVREWAAWAASRIGGRKMFSLLSRAVELRNGRDSKVTAYAALVGGDQAIPLLRRYRAIEMQYVGWERGRAQERLNWVLVQLERGRAIDALDQPPPRLSLMP